MSDKKKISKEAKKLQKKTKKAVKNIKQAAQSFQEKESFMEELLVKNFSEISSNKKKK